MNVMMNAWSWIPGSHKMVNYMIEKMGSLAEQMDADYVAEMSGMATASGFDLSEVFVFNIMYELSVACTSIGKGSINKGHPLNKLFSCSR